MEIIAIIIAVVLVGIFVYSYRDTSTPPPIEVPLKKKAAPKAVSYTHLTLPTILLV